MEIVGLFQKLNDMTDAINQARIAVMFPKPDIDWEYVLRNLVIVDQALERAHVYAVASAREQGSTWATIGEGLHIHESTARLRYKDHLEVLRITRQIRLCFVAFRPAAPGRCRPIRSPS